MFTSASFHSSQTLPLNPSGSIYSKWIRGVSCKCPQHGFQLSWFQQVRGCLGDVFLLSLRCGLESGAAVPLTFQARIFRIFIFMIVGRGVLGTILGCYSIDKMIVFRLGGL